MWPWGHVAVGYLIYSGVRRYRVGLPPTGPAALAVVFGTQLPDLVDKPLAWTFEILPTGRSLAHSWLVAAVVLAVAWVLLDERRDGLVVPLGVGGLSHGFADGLYSILAREPAYLGYLLWPLTTTPAYDTDPSFLAHLLGVELTPYFALQGLLFGVAVFVWHRDGRPGLETIRAGIDVVAARTPR